MPVLNPTYPGYTYLRPTCIDCVEDDGETGIDCVEDGNDDPLCGDGWRLYGLFLAVTPVPSLMGAPNINLSLRNHMVPS